MTCIVAYIDGNGVGHMAADSAGTDVGQHTRSENVHPKIFKNGDFLIGYTTSFRMGQILQYGFSPPAHPEKMDDYAYIVTEVVPAIRNAFVEGHYKKEDALTGGSFILIYKKKLFTIQDDYAVFETPSNFSSVGSGGTQAIAAFEAMKQYNLIDKKSVKLWLTGIIEIVSRINITVSGRIDYLSTKK